MYIIYFLYIIYIYLRGIYKQSLSVYTVIGVIIIPISTVILAIISWCGDNAYHNLDDKKKTHVMRLYNTKCRGALHASSANNTLIISPTHRQSDRFLPVCVHQNLCWRHVLPVHYRSAHPTWVGGSVSIGYRGWGYQQQHSCNLWPDQ